GSLANMELAHAWLDKCLQRHHMCGSPLSNALLPTRVLDVGASDRDEIHLWETNEASGNYIALSYWGGQKNLQRDANLKFIDFKTLSPTLRDAIIVSRTLHLRYVWIDALCIPQDCEDNKRKELSNMASVYEHATITLMAASA
ncbi:heterokaryon incompatibility protein-domain-containing protein, partial [Bisporella sp. PMI_857]